MYNMGGVGMLTLDFQRVRKRGVGTERERGGGDSERERRELG